MLEGVDNVLSRIQDIKASFGKSCPVDPSAFAAHLDQAKAAMAAEANPTNGLPPSLAATNPSMFGLMQRPDSTFNILGSKLEKAAAEQDGRQYWTNACAHAVNDVLKKCGIDIADKVKNNPDWVPNYAELGSKVASVNDMKPGDLVIYNNEIGQGGFDHIGIYAGNGEAWNVSTVHGHKWVKTPIGSRFQEGRRITVPM
jgi:hypothetical protein